MSLGRRTIVGAQDDRIEVSHATLGAILAEAAAFPAREVCGLLFGDAARIADHALTANVAADPARTFEIDPARLLAAHKAQRSGGPRLIGHYHSHPSGSSAPSAADLAASQPGQLWLIVAAGRAQAWRARGDRFDEIALHVA